MQERRVRRVNPNFKGLKPVTIDPPLESKGVRIRSNKAIEARKFRRRTGPQISEQNPAMLDHRIGLLPDITAQIAILRLRRRLQAPSLDIKQRAMKSAAQTAVLETAIGKVGACLLYTSPSPRDTERSRMPSSA